VILARFGVDLEVSSVLQKLDLKSPYFTESINKRRLTTHLETLETILKLITERHFYGGVLFYWWEHGSGLGVHF